MEAAVITTPRHQDAVPEDSIRVDTEVLGAGVALLEPPTKAMDPPVDVTQTAIAPDELSFGQAFGVATLSAVAAILVVTMLAWWATAGDLVDGLVLGAYLAFWFGPAAGVIGGGTYWVSKTHPGES